MREKSKPLGMLKPLCFGTLNDLSPSFEFEKITFERGNVSLERIQGWLKRRIFSGAIVTMPLINGIPSIFATGAA